MKKLRLRGNVIYPNRKHVAELGFEPSLSILRTSDLNPLLLCVYMCVYICIHVYICTRMCVEYR